MPGLPRGLKTLGKISLSHTWYKSLDHIEETCSESFNTATKFIHHMRQVHKTKPWICTECPELKRQVFYIIRLVQKIFLEFTAVPDTQYDGSFE